MSKGEEDKHNIVTSETEVGVAGRHNRQGLVILCYTTYGVESVQNLLLNVIKWDICNNNKYSLCLLGHR